MSDALQGGAVAATALRASLLRSGRWAAGLAAIGGFVADVLQPLAPFAALTLVGNQSPYVLAEFRERA